MKTEKYPRNIDKITQYRIASNPGIALINIKISTG